MMKFIDFKSGVRDQKHYLYELESLRGLAIILVIAFHFWGIVKGGDPVEHGLLLSFISSGSTGVTLFFLLSGFLLSMPFLRGLNCGEHPSVTQYYISRALRIIPLYYIAIIFSIVVTGKVTEVMPAFWFQPVGFDVFPYSVVWWTLSTEVQFYLLLPIIMYFLRSSRGKVFILACFVIWLVFYYQFSIANPKNIFHPGRFFLTKSVFARFPAFLLGVLGAAFYLRYSAASAALKESMVFRLVGLFLTFGFFYLLGVVLQHTSAMGGVQAEFNWHIKNTYEALCWLGILLSVLMASPLVKSILVNPFTGIIGKLSYSLYLVHVPIVFYLIYPMSQQLGPEMFFHSPSAIMLCIFIVIVCIIVSYITYHFIELPFLKLKEHIPLMGKVLVAKFTSLKRLYRTGKKTNT